jgi:hypothetical protein
MAFRIPTHVRTFLFLAPFAAMLVVHRVLGLSDNLMVAPEAGEPDGAIYNLIMVLVLWAGIIGFLIHATLHASESTRWVVAKFAVLAAILATMVYMSESARIQ